MEVAHIYQPPNSTSCGQHCIAMLAERPVAEVITAIGHSRATRTKELKAALVQFGLHPATERLVRVKDLSEVPEVAIIKIRWDKGGHWVVCHNKTIYDPAYGIYPLTIEYIPEGGRITSYLGVNKAA